MLLTSHHRIKSWEFGKQPTLWEKATWTLAIVIMVRHSYRIRFYNGQQSSVSEIKDIVNTEAPAALPGFVTPATGNNATPAQEAPVQKLLQTENMKRLL